MLSPVGWLIWDIDARALAADVRIRRKSFDDAFTSGVYAPGLCFTPRTVRFHIISSQRLAARAN